MKQTVKVILTNPDHTAMIEVMRFPACAGCDAQNGCAACDQAESRPQRALVRNPIDAQPGEIVVIETESSRLLMTAFILYILPLIAFIAGYMLGGTALWGAAAVVPTGILAFIYNRRVSGNGFLTATIVSRGDEES
ncbi:MAG: SoxR reducing system RseC family protein [Clostridiaceae bacterium]|nr:SoxR reducing system RseC family protein [Clostridiaceae bacterium]